MNSKLIILDVDGTLLTSDHRILRSTRRVLDSAQERGHQIMLASGRFPGAVLPILEDLDRMDCLYIASSGALIGRGEEILYEETCPTEPLEKAVAHARELKLSVDGYTGSRWEVMDWRDEVAHEAAVVGCQPTLVSKLNLKGAHKVMIIAGEDDCASYSAWVQHNIPELKCQLFSANMVDLVKLGVSKGTALAWAANYLDFPLQDTIALGDGLNDLEILEIAGISVAMGNAVPDVKNRANFVTSSNDQGGVAWALAQILRLRQSGEHHEAAGEDPTKPDKKSVPDSKSAPKAKL